ncbi:MAG TPA: CcmD family protein [Flavisolibacter sp.]|nr:CcmD family protein [Flavisolibacter sp.]
MRKSVLFLFISLITSIFSFAQQQTEAVSMADTMRQNGKIYVVVAVILAIFTGIILYLIRLDRKISRLEKETHKNY